MAAAPSTLVLATALLAAVALVRVTAASAADQLRGTAPMSQQVISQEVVAELAPTGTLRAGINLSNFLLVTGKSPSGEPEGVAPDMAREIAVRLGVPVAYVTYKSPGELADKADSGAWDI